MRACTRPHVLFFTTRCFTADDPRLVSNRLLRFRAAAAAAAAAAGLAEADDRSGHRRGRGLFVTDR